jgi:hypothetical protein
VARRGRRLWAVFHARARRYAAPAPRHRGAWRLNAPSPHLPPAAPNPAPARQVGWDVFSLHYELGAPLSSVFTPAALASYRRVARLQWRLLRAERSLGLAWRTLKVR